MPSSACFDGGLQAFDPPLDFRGTAFQRRGWAELLLIPFGETRTYGAIARALGDPKLMRAVGAANGRPPPRSRRRAIAWWAPGRGRTCSGRGTPRLRRWAAFSVAVQGARAILTGMSVPRSLETHRPPVRRSARRPAVDDRRPEPVDPAHLDALRQGIEAERRGDIATDDEVRAAFARLRA